MNEEFCFFYFVFKRENNLIHIWLIISINMENLWAKNKKVNELKNCMAWQATQYTFWYLLVNKLLVKKFIWGQLWALSKLLAVQISVEIGSEIGLAMKNTFCKQEQIVHRMTR